MSAHSTWPSESESVAQARTRERERITCAGAGRGTPAPPQVTKVALVRMYQRFRVSLHPRQPLPLKMKTGLLITG